MELSTLGWNAHFIQHFADLGQKTWRPARVGRAHGRLYYLYAEEGELEAELAGRLKHLAISASELRRSPPSRRARWPV